MRQTILSSGLGMKLLKFTLDPKNLENEFDIEFTRYTEVPTGNWIQKLLGKKKTIKTTFQKTYIGYGIHWRDESTGAYAELEILYKLNDWCWLKYREAKKNSFDENI